MLIFSENYDKTSDKTIPINNKNELKMQSGVNSNCNDKDNNEQWMLPLKKPKWVLADDLIKVIELYFKSLEFQNMAQFNRMKNIVV